MNVKNGDWMRKRSKFLEEFEKRGDRQQQDKNNGIPHSFMVKKFSQKDQKHPPKEKLQKRRLEEKEEHGKNKENDYCTKTKKNKKSFWTNSKQGRKTLLT